MATAWIRTSSAVNGRTLKSARRTLRSCIRLAQGAVSVASRPVKLGLDVVGPGSLCRVEHCKCYSCSAYGSCLASWPRFSREGLQAVLFNMAVHV
eukprot:347241-Chlamydomonas_euryale.AAC.3